MKSQEFGFVSVKFLKKMKNWQKISKKRFSDQTFRIINMWKSLFTDLYQNLINSSDDTNERIVLGIHLFNIAKGLQCTGLQETDVETNEILPAN